ncbi:structural maintenance of chromosomes protein 3 [Nephila pilipes]|uniref:Structural maintenance of chromosomes protein 3 n=1 Tax=Nephila pilipes TaxID=299642 RepID=A0A8X6P550_NEPPI|nr:structural maintenance of chromosomes protein 3 [Nephila pilipes]
MLKELSIRGHVVRSVTDGGTLNDHDNVSKVLQNFIDKGGSLNLSDTSYYGMLIENFDCDKTIYKTSEATFSNKLFYEIVDNDKIGTKVVQEMNLQQLSCETTFLLINIFMYKKIS